MDVVLQDRFVELWSRYFEGAELPFCLFYSDDEKYDEFLRPAPEHLCVVAQLNLVRRGETLAVTEESVGCFGGRKYLGFSDEVRPNFEYFLSCGIPGEMEGERYKKTPELVREVVEEWPSFEAPARYAVFKRWDRLQEDDRPAVVIFYAPPPVLSGLFTLSNFDETDPNAAISPFGAGCATIVQWPYMEGQRDHPRSVLGMFDVSARPCVPTSTLSFATPMEKFRAMVEDMEESFLITESWQKVRGRIREREAE